MGASIEAGSLEDLTSLVQRELEVSSELDQSLLNHLVSKESQAVQKNAHISSSTNDDLGRSEMQRLLQKVQEEGLAVLSLSERLFLAHHAERRGGGGRSESTEDQLETVERDWARRLELLQFRIQQEKVVAEDLRRALDSEKRHSLELLSSLSRERQQKSDLEEQLVVLRRQAKQRSLSLVSDSDNEEFLNTIEAQKRQIECLEDSLQREKDNFDQLQQVLQAERLRIKQASPEFGGCEEAPGEVASLIISHLRRELDEERQRVGDLLIHLDKEKRQHQLSLRRSEAGASTTWGESEVSRQAAQEGEPWREAWRNREFELERLVAELELKVELLEREERRLREAGQRLEHELEEERKRGASGLLI